MQGSTASAFPNVVPSPRRRVIGGGRQLDIKSHFDSLTMELQALRNRVENLIDHRHWQTAGEWKDSVLRTFLRRHLPKSVEIGRGFVVSSIGISTQIDVLIYDSSKPVLFRDGDLVMTTPDAVLCILEVKSNVTMSSLRHSLAKLSANGEILRHHSIGPKVVGLFSYGFHNGETTKPKTLLKALQTAARGSHKRRIDLLALGESNFVRYWDSDPDTDTNMIYEWHSYRLPQTAFGYFLHNVVKEICRSSVDANKGFWFPYEGKGQFKTGSMRL